MFSTLQGYIAKPFSEDQDLFHWFLFFGILVISVILWAMLIRTISAID